MTTTITPTIMARRSDTGVQGWIFQWAGLTNGAVGAAIPSTMVGFPDRTIQVEGTFGVGGTVQLQGSNDGVNFRELNDPFGTPISITAGSVRQVTEAVDQMQPSVTAGDATTTLTVTMFLRRPLQ
jgi:hypothetical protein